MKSSFFRRFGIGLVMLISSGGTHAQDMGMGGSPGASSAPSAFANEFSLSGGYLGLTPESGGYNIAPGYYFKPLKMDLIQIGGEIGYQNTVHRGVSATNVTILGGVTLNFGNLTNAFYFMLGLAFKSGTGGSVEDTTLDDPDGFGYHFLVGKRFSIGNSQRWVLKPSLGVIYGGTGGFVVRPLAVSYLF